jgi:hypothetical protein
MARVNACPSGDGQRREQATAVNEQRREQKQISPLRCGMTNREQAGAGDLWEKGASGRGGASGIGVLRLRFSR